MMMILLMLVVVGISIVVIAIAVLSVLLLGVCILRRICLQILFLGIFCNLVSVNVMWGLSSNSLFGIAKRVGLSIFEWILLLLLLA